MRLSELLALITLGVAGSGFPGPNNTLLLASGVRFGFKQTLPHILGAALGVGMLVLAVAAGGGAAFETFPASQLVLKIVGSIYLLFFAFKSAVSATIASASVAKPLSALQAGLFQFVNPKAWVFAITVVAASLPPELSSLVGGPLIAMILTVVVAATFAVWVLGGAALSRVVASDKATRSLNLALALLLVASVTFLWI